MKTSDEIRYDKERVVKHLEMIQGVINRLAQCSFLIRGWSMTILAAAILFIARERVDAAAWVMFCFLVPVIGFWILDGYFLWQERIFRGIYNDVRLQDTTDFSMDISAQKGKPGCKWLLAILSLTLIIFYVVEILFILAAFLVLG